MTARRVLIGAAASVGALLMGLGVFVARLSRMLEGRES